MELGTCHWDNKPHERLPTCQHWHLIVPVAQGVEPRPKQTNCQNEPPYPGKETVVLSIRDPEQTAHAASERCPIEPPHAIKDCGEFKAQGVEVEVVRGAFSQEKIEWIAKESPQIDARILARQLLAALKRIAELELKEATPEQIVERERQYLAEKERNAELMRLCEGLQKELADAKGKV